MPYYILQMKGYMPDVTKPQNCKKLVSHFIQLSKQRFILCQTWLTVTLTVQCCNLVNFSGTKNKGYFIFNFTLKYLSFSMLWVSHLWLVTLQIRGETILEFRISLNGRILYISRCHIFGNKGSLCDKVTNLLSHQHMLTYLFIQHLTNGSPS
jgi:hypothetical protein